MHLSSGMSVGAIAVVRVFEPGLEDNSNSDEFMGAAGSTRSNA
jgi:hypothetical protein